MAFELRDYQSILIDKARDALRRGRRSIVLVMPTGGGKTCVSGTIIGNATARGSDAWFINHRRELIRQSSKTFDKVGIEHGIVSSGFTMAPYQHAQICGIGSLPSRMGKLRAPKIIVWDECHHIAAGTWAKVLEAYPDAIHIGVTATPIRMDGAGLGDWFEELIEGPSMRWLIDQGYLSKYRLLGAPPLDMSTLKTRAGEFTSESVAELVDDPKIIGDAVKHYQQHCPGARNIVFAANIAHSQHIVERFRAAGYPAAHLDGTSKDRDAVLAAFERGEIRVLSNVDLFGEGFDVPSIEAVTLLRPTRSTGLYLQQVGRALRPAPGKEHAIILDHVGNWQRHGLPDDDRQWNIDPKVKMKRGDNDNENLKIKQCPSCFSVHSMFDQSCPECGHVYEQQQRGQIEEVDGNLVEITKALEKRNKKREQALAKTLDELIRLGEQRGHKNPRKWAQIIFDSRKKKADHSMMRFG